MKRIIFLAALLILSTNIFAKSTLEISILTCAPGNEVYSVYGHSGIRVYDLENDIDVVYNFGLFDFETPNFALKFISGRLFYSLGVQSIENFMFEYIYYEREVIEQKLELDDFTKKLILDRLNYLYLPENRDYIYSFLKKNCTSEIRDILILAGVEFRDDKLETTSRQAINYHLRNHLWLKFGTDLLIGKRLDKKTDVFESMFLPETFMQELRFAKLNGEKIVKDELVINPVESKTTNNRFRFFSPLLVFSIIFLLLTIKFPKSIMIFISVLFGTTGILLLAIWIFSGHPEIKLNFNIFWANPLYLIYVPYLIKNRVSKQTAIILFSFLALAIIVWIFKIQMFNISVLPLIGILTLLNIKMYNKNITIWGKIKNFKK